MHPWLPSIMPPYPLTLACPMEKPHSPQTTSTQLKSTEQAARCKSGRLNHTPRLSWGSASAILAPHTLLPAIMQGKTTSPAARLLAE